MVRPQPPKPVPHAPPGLVMPELRATEQAIFPPLPPNTNYSGRRDELVKIRDAFFPADSPGGHPVPYGIIQASNCKRLRVVIHEGPRTKIWRYASEMAVTFLRGKFNLV